MTHNVLRLVAEIDEFKGRWEALANLAPERLLSLRRVATIESVASSTRIEGAQLSDREVENLLANLEIGSFKTRDEQEVAGYAAVMNLIFTAADELQISENHFKQLHSTLLSFSDKDKRHRGEYKKLPNNVVAFDSDGREIGVVFETVTPFDTPRAMTELIEWTRTAQGDKSLHPLLVIAVFVVCFLFIHPFQDGNGRLSRILTTLLLLKAGYEYVPFASLESVIEENKDSYYINLRKTQTSLRSAEPDWESWTRFFLECLKKQKDNLQKKVERERILSQRLLPLALEILRLLKEHERLSIAEIQKLTGANRNTLKVRLRELTQNNLVKQNGSGRATQYALKAKSQ